jgi:L-ascorbate metabolism protein UlaG (beta-lactamase superfamily)
MSFFKASVAILILLTLGSCAYMIARQQSNPTTPATVFKNAYLVAEDTGERVKPTYFFRRAWVQLTRDLPTTEVPPVIPVDLPAMQQQVFAVAWLGHAAMLVRAGDLWILIDPVLSDTAGPVQGFGPARLVSLPLAPEQLPHIDVVLISHDHFDHLDLTTIQKVAAQTGSAPQFFVGRGLAEWFRWNAGSTAREFDWWDIARVGETSFRFVPAQHNSGRTPFHRNTTLWGGWVIGHASKQFYFPGDTAFVSRLFEDIRQRVGPIDLAALPIGAYEPRALMRFEHLNPDDALQAHQALQAKRSFGVHWGTFQLGDEEPFQAALDLAQAMKRSTTAEVGLIPVGGFVAVDCCHAGDLRRAADLQPVFARPAPKTLGLASGQR